MTTHCMAINYEVFEQAGALQYLDEETRTWTTDDFVKAMETIRDSGLAAVPGILYCGGQGGDQGTRALVNILYSGTYTNPEHTEYNRQQPRERQGSGAAQEHGGQPQPERQRPASRQQTSCSSSPTAPPPSPSAGTRPTRPSMLPRSPSPRMPWHSPPMTACLSCAAVSGASASSTAATTPALRLPRPLSSFVCDDADQAAESVRLTGFFPVKDSLGDVYEGHRPGRADGRVRSPDALPG